MRYVRVYADSSGESHFEDVELPMETGSGGGQRSEGLPVSPGGLIFAHHPAGYESGWHTVSRRQVVLTLSGLAELEASDGQRRQIGAGGVLLAEDTTGKGHLLRILEERQCAYVPLEPLEIAGR
jgi:hypothetical protein